MLTDLAARAQTGNKETPQERLQEGHDDLLALRGLKKIDENNVSDFPFPWNVQFAQLVFFLVCWTMLDLALLVGPQDL